MIELEHAAESLTAYDLTIWLADVIDGFAELIIEPLVIAFSVIVFEIGS